MSGITFNKITILILAISFGSCVIADRFSQVVLLVASELNYFHDFKKSSNMQFLLRMAPLCTLIFRCYVTDVIILVWPTSWTPAIGGLIVCVCVCVCMSE